MRALDHSLRLAGPALALLASCAPIRYSSQEVTLRHRAESDALDVLILYEGIQAEPQDGKDGIGVAWKFADRVASGRREFMICDWPIHFDIDKIASSLPGIDPDDRDPWSKWQREGLEHLERIHVVASGPYEGKEGRLSLYQQFRVEHWSQFVEWLDRSLRLWISECDAKGTLQHELPLFDAQTRSAWVDLAKTNGRWLWIREGGVEMKLPMSPADAARILGRTLEQAEEPSFAKFLAAVASGIGEVEIASGQLRVAWNAKDGAVRFRFTGPEEYDGNLSKQLTATDGFPAKLPTQEDVIRRFQSD